MNNTFNIDITIKATISGVRYSQRYNELSKSFEEDKTSFQVQTLSFKENGEILKSTLKVNKQVSEEQLKGMINKTYIFSEVEEYAHNNNGFTTYTYSAKSFKETKSDKPIFNVNKSVKILVSNVIEEVKQGKPTGSTKIQTIVQNGLSVDLKTIKIKNIPYIMLKDLKDKNIMVSNIRVSKMEGGKTYYSTETKPEIVNN